MALDIKEHTQKVEYTRRLIQLAKAPAKHEKSRKIKRAQAVFRKRGIEDIPDFVDYGYPYRRIAGRLHCGPQTVKYIIALGESLDMFIAQKRELVLVEYIKCGNAQLALQHYEDKHRATFATYHNIYYRPATTFLLVDGRKHLL